MIRVWTKGRKSTCFTCRKSIIVVIMNRANSSKSWRMAAGALRRCRRSVAGKQLTLLMKRRGERYRCSGDATLCRIIEDRK